MQPPELVERPALRSLDTARGGAFAEIGSALAFSLPAMPDVRMVHHTVGLGEDEPADDAVLDEVGAFYGDLDVRFDACVTPTAQPADLRERVGAEAGGDFATIVLQAYGMPAEGFATVAAVPGIDSWSTYVGYDEGAPAAGALFVADGLGWLSFAGTLPEHRRKGGQGAILAARIAQARELGGTALVTETGVRAEGRPSNSYRKIFRSGFGEAYVRENHLSP